MTTVPQTLSLAQQYHQAGNLFQAEQLYRQILQADPQHFEATLWLGLIAHQTGHNDQAIN